MSGLEVLSQATPEHTLLAQSGLFHQSNLEAFVFSKFQLEISESSIPQFHFLITPCCTLEVEVPFQKFHIFEHLERLPFAVIRNANNILLKHHCGIHHKTLPVEYISWKLHTYSSSFQIFLDVKYSLFHHPLYIGEWFLRGLLFQNYIISESEKLKKNQKYYDFYSHLGQLRHYVLLLGLQNTEPTLLPFLLVKNKQGVYYFHQKLVGQR